MNPSDQRPQRYSKRLPLEEDCSVPGQVSEKKKESNDGLENVDNEH